MGWETGPHLVAWGARSARRKFYVIIMYRSNLLYYLAKWSNLAIKYLRSKVVKFWARIKNRLPDYGEGVHKVLIRHHLPPPRPCTACALHLSYLHLACHSHK